MLSNLHERPPLIIAELSANHNRSYERAIRLIDAAKEAGADGIKLQTYKASSLTMDIDRPDFRIGDFGTPWDGQTLFDLYSEGATPWHWQESLFKYAKKLGLFAFSTPFDEEAVGYLDRLDVPAMKIASFEITDIPLIQKAAATGRPLILSTGMATVAEIDEAVRAVQKAGCQNLILLKCTSSYPAPANTSNLLTIPHMRRLFGVPVGLSDHTLGIGVAAASAALGAVMVEKHFTLNRSDGGVDAAFSLEPPELRLLVAETRRAWEALGAIYYGPSESDRTSLQWRRSLYITENMKAGEKLTKKNLRSIRPGHGLPPKYLSILLGKKVNRDVQRGTAMSWDLIG